MGETDAVDEEEGGETTGPLFADCRPDYTQPGTTCSTNALINKRINTLALLSGLDGAQAPATSGTADLSNQVFSSPAVSAS